MYLFDNEARGSPTGNILPVDGDMVCFICRHLMQRVITINLEEGE
jgi:hypothetical protein